MSKNIKLIRNLRTRVNKYGNPGIFLEPTVLEAGNFKVGESISYTFTNQALIIKKDEDTPYKVAKRKRPSWPAHRPLIDYSNADLAVFSPRKKKSIFWYPILLL
ncbi:hypothetical protein [Cytobacillus firmus]|uniref:hypothetical protein n=1 Tax=Cytobacillus firmus TaxID=1399 RepID=UPI00300293F4